MELELKRTEGCIEGAKRQNFPYTLTWTCKGCGAKHTIDYLDQYLSHPNFGGPTKEYLYCDDCDHEEIVYLIPRLTLEIANENDQG